MNKPIKTFLAALILVTCGVQHGRSQETSIAPVDQLKKYRLGNYQEKVYLHTDRTFYITGDYLWFRVRLVNGTSHETATISKVVYVELLEAGKPVLQAKVPVNEGVGYSAIYLPTSLNSAVYQLRAYTKWMQNYPA